MLNIGLKPDDVHFTRSGICWYSKKKCLCFTIGGGEQNNKCSSPKLRRRFYRLSSKRFKFRNFQYSLCTHKWKISCDIRTFEKPFVAKAVE